MAFRTECDWSIRLQGDGTARHEIELRLHDLPAALGSSVYQTLSVDLEGVYRSPEARAPDGTTIPVDYQPVRGERYNRLSLKLRDLELLVRHPEPALVVVTFVQEGALNALGPIEFYPLNVEATALRTTSSKVVVWAPRLWLAGRLVQWLSTKLRRPLYPIWSFEIGSQAMRGRVLSSARRVEYASGRVIPGSAVAFVSHLSVNIFAWLLSMLVLAGIGIVVGIVATKLAERI